MTLSLDKYRHIHFVGIGGIGMSALARHLLAQGHEVSGSDRSPGEQGDELRRLGARVHSGHAREYVDGAELVVVSSAVSLQNPELVAAREAGIPVVKRSEVLGAIMNPRYGIAVAGTHGKTTTSALIAHVLIQAGLDPTVLIGGISKSLGSNARVGAGEIVVAEADEYDASFLRLQPRIAVITNLEPDHLDFYETPERVYQAFRAFAERVSEVLVICADDPHTPSLAGASPGRVVTYGLHCGDWQANDVRERGDRTLFCVRHEGRTREYTIPQAGLHNVRNALAAIAVASTLGVAGDQIADALAGFAGVGRRLEIVGEAAGVLVMDSYGHHPTEIRCDLSAVRARYDRPIHLVFQPHTYSRTHAFLDDFAASFGHADRVYLLDIYAARETDTLGISGRDLATAAARRHPNVVYGETMEGTLGSVLQSVHAGDLVITMGAGDVFQLAPRLLASLEAA